MADEASIEFSGQLQQLKDHGARSTGARGGEYEGLAFADIWPTQTRPAPVAQPNWTHLRSMTPWKVDQPRAEPACGRARFCRLKRARAKARIFTPSKKVSLAESVPLTRDLQTAGANIAGDREDAHSGLRPRNRGV
jgi:hypothetical protein